MTGDSAHLADASARARRQLRILSIVAERVIVFREAHSGRARARHAALALVAVISCSLSAPPLVQAQESQTARGDTAEASLRAGRAMVIQTIPRLRGVTFSIDGRRFQSDRLGRVSLPVTSRAELERRVRVLDTVVRPGVRARFSGWYRGSPTFALYYAVRLRFVDVAGNAIDPAAIESVELLSSNGLPETYTDFDGGRRLWLQGRGIVPAGLHQESKDVSQVVQRVVVDDANVVNQGQQRFYPARSRDARIEVLFFSARFEVRDALFGFPIGSEVKLHYPSGRVERHDLGSDGDIRFRALPRGRYEIGVEAAGWSFDRPMSLSREQNVRLQVISYFDVGVIILGLMCGVLIILFIGRPHLIPVYGKRLSRRAVAASNR